MISGAISSAMMFLTLPLLNNDTINNDNGEVIGYAAIFLSMLLVFFGIKPFPVGLVVTLVSAPILRRRAAPQVAVAGTPA